MVGNVNFWSDDINLISRKRPSNPWMTTDIKRLLRRRQKAFSRARHKNKTADWARYKQLKTTVQREARKAHDQYVDNTIFGDMKNNTKPFWHCSSPEASPQTTALRSARTNPTMDHGLPQQQTATSPPRWPYFINSRSVIRSTTGNRSRSSAFLNFHQWLSRSHQLRGTPLRRWLPTIQTHLQ